MSVASDDSLRHLDYQVHYHCNIISQTTYGIFPNVPQIWSQDAMSNNELKFLQSWCRSILKQHVAVACVFSISQLSDLRFLLQGQWEKLREHSTFASCRVLHCWCRQWLLLLVKLGTKNTKLPQHLSLNKIRLVKCQNIHYSKLQ